MKLVSVGKSCEQGPRLEMQDIALVEPSPDGAYYLGVFDGHDTDGDMFSLMAAEVVKQNADRIDNKKLDARGQAYIVRSALRSLHHALSRKKFEAIGGTTATVAIAKGGEVAIAQIGDSEAVFYPDFGKEERLVKTHNTDNSEEVRRVNKAGFAAKDNYFIYHGGFLAVSRAIGDFHCGFVLPEAEVSLYKPYTSGTLVVATDGVWGKGAYYEVEEMVRKSDMHPQFLARDLVAALAVQNKDNAAAVVARFE